MARLYAQLFTLIFLVLTIVGLVAGTAGHPATGEAGGNLGAVTLHMTWERDLLNVGLVAVLAWVGFFASRGAGRLTVIAVGAVLLALAVGGFVASDDDIASKGFLGMHYPLTVNLVDLVAGVLGILCGLGTIEEPAAAPR